MSSLSSNVWIKHIKTVLLDQTKGHLDSGSSSFSLTITMWGRLKWERMPVSWWFSDVHGRVVLWTQDSPFLGQQSWHHNRMTGKEERIAWESWVCFKIKTVEKERYSGYFALIWFLPKLLENLVSEEEEIYQDRSRVGIEDCGAGDWENGLEIRVRLISGLSDCLLSRTQAPSCLSPIFLCPSFPVLLFLQRVVVETHLNRIRCLEQQLRQRESNPFQNLNSQLQNQEVQYLSLHGSHGESLDFVHLGKRALLSF